MSDAPPQLGEIPQQSELNVPTIKSQNDGNAASNGTGNFNATASYQNAKQSLYHSEVSIRCPPQQSLFLLCLLFADIAVLQFSQELL